MTKEEVKLICENDPQMQWWAMVLFAEIMAVVDSLKDNDKDLAFYTRLKTDEFPRLVVQNQINKFKKLQEEAVDEDDED